MQPDKARANLRKTRREEFELASDSTELSRRPQRKLLQQQMESAGSGATAAHGEDSSFDSHGSPPQHDRAG